jgi:N-acylneuraminate cytidylyltransferase
MEMFQPQYFNARSQDLECAWHDAGQFYWGKTQAWLDCKPIFGPGAVPVILPKYRVQDIDTLEDWERAENMFELLRK